MQIENARLKLALVIPTSAPITFANDALEILPVVANLLLIYYLVSLLLINSLSLISVTK